MLQFYGIFRNSMGENQTEFDLKIVS